ncbi:MAG TPA: cytochrome c biogenesis protein CcsA [Desulfomonilia bacterium]|nr:cytochrome c biogenesis protein CcsA [Desulfomonilia bacterium]
MTISAVLILYSIASLGFITYLFLRKDIILMALRILFAVCIIAHSLFVIALWSTTGQLPVATPTEALNILILFSSIAFFPFIVKKSTSVLGAFFMPLACCVLAFIAGSLQSVPEALIGSYRYWYPLHTLSVIMGEAFFVVAAIVSVVYLIHERNIKTGSIHSSASALPPLTMLDSILYISLSLGFIAITAGMILGGLWAWALGLMFSHIAPKVLAGALTWLVFALSLHQRFAIGWKGRRTAVITLIGFALMVVLFLIITFVFPESHGIRLV